MRRTLAILLMLSAIGVLLSAQEDKPSLPKVPRGFDEGRTLLVEEAAEGMVEPDALIERLFEYADTPTIAEFIHLHMTRDDKSALDKQLKLGDRLAATADLSGVIKLLDGAKPAGVAAAIGRVLKARKYTLADTVAWLAARDFNFRAMQSAMNGERIDAFRVKRSVRDGDVAKAITTGAWEFNLLDAREEKGGHYDGVQLVETMLALGFTVDDFVWINAHADEAIARDMPAYERDLVRWGDPALIWETFNARMPERTLFNAILKRHTDVAKARSVAALRADCTLRWLRTGGPGVKAVYRGPWPDNTGAPVPPSEDVLAIGKADVKQFADALTEPIQEHFKASAESITIVVYDDGSSRAIIDKPRREPVNYGPASPFGNVATTRQGYEGRVSLPGRGALLYLVYAGDQKVAPPQFELANVQLTIGEAFLLADIDDGLNLTPILLRRVTRMVE
ncbi:MAG: hypothetical protein K8I27_07960 [Planctomycetes bacterium]|nr:hypothetical protein [Planctomycetota bacterium]